MTDEKAKAIDSGTWRYLRNCILELDLMNENTPQFVWFCFAKR